MLHSQGAVHDLHDDNTVLHEESSLLRATNGHLYQRPSLLPQGAPLRDLYDDSLRAASGVPAGSGADMLPEPLLCSQLR